MPSKFADQLKKKMTKNRIDHLVRKYGEQLPLEDKLPFDGFLRARKDLLGASKFNENKEKLLFTVFNQSKTGSLDRIELYDYFADHVTLDQAKLFV